MFRHPYVIIINQMSKKKETQPKSWWLTKKSYVAAFKRLWVQIMLKPLLFTWQVGNLRDKCRKKRKSSCEILWLAGRCHAPVVGGYRFKSRSGTPRHGCGCGCGCGCQLKSPSKEILDGALRCAEARGRSEGGTREGGEITRAPPPGLQEEDEQRL